MDTVQKQLMGYIYVLYWNVGIIIYVYAPFKAPS
jgi:hypothetical protein